MTWPPLPAPDFEHGRRADFGIGDPPPGYVRAEKLLRVVPLAKSVPVGPGVATLVALEVYEDGSILTFVAVPNEENRPKPPTAEERLQQAASLRELAQSDDKTAILRFIEEQDGHPFREYFHRRFMVRIQDDVGTAYSPPMWGRAGGSETWRGSFSYTPAIPDAAGQVRFVLGVAEAETPQTPSVVVDL
jgi:hypothetical protein